MCGIAGLMIAPGDRGLLDTRLMTASLAYDMMARGKDATGIATVDFKGRWKVRKKDVAADVFLAGRHGIGTNAQSVLIHTRAATQGKPHIMENKHPIRHGSIIGIHNGMVSNDYALFSHYGWERNGQVDSEAIFAAINHLDLEEALTNIDASWAIAWFDVSEDPRRLWLARGFSSPLFYGLTVNGSVVFASTEQAVKEAYEWGGMKDEAIVAKADEGFLAHTNPDEGGITILPEFDGSGSNAIGARKSTVRSVWGGYDWDMEESWRSASSTGGSATARWIPRRSSAFNGGSHVVSSERDPASYERVWISGDPKQPKIGDRRKYKTSTGQWITEACISASGIYGAPGTWSILIGDGESTASGMQLEKPEVVHHPVRTPLELVDPFDDEDDIEAYEQFEEDEFKYGFADIGEYIGIRKSFFDGGEGVLVGKVTGVDTDTKELFVEFWATRIAHDAYYERLSAPVNEEGAMNA